MKAGTLLTIAAAGAGALFLANAAGLADAGDKLQISPAGVDFEDWVGGILGGAKGKLRLSVTNPTKHNLPVTYLNLQLLNGDSALATFNNKGENVTFKALTTADWLLPLNVTALSLAKNLGGSIMDFINGKPLPSKLTLLGNVVAGGFNSPYKEEVPVAWPKFLQPKKSS